MIRLLRKLDWRQTARNLIVFFYLLLGASCEKGEDMIDIDDLRINEIQVIGSHNSYRITGPNPGWCNRFGMVK